MISLFPNIHFPKEVAHRILLAAADSTEALKIYSQVSKNFKLAADDEGFLYSLLIKFKGNGFSDIPAPKKFLILDQMMMAAYQSQIGKKGSGFEHTILKTTSVLTLKDLNLRLVAITNQTTITYFRISTFQLENLKNADITKQDEWQDCVERIVRDIIEHKFPAEAQINLSDGLIDLFKQIEACFLAPNDKMQQLINDFEITDMFFPCANQLIVHAHKVKGLSPHMLQSAVSDPGHAQTLDVSCLLRNWIDATDLMVMNNALTVKLEVTQYQMLRNKLNDLNSKQLEALALMFLPHEKYLVNLAFPTLWPNFLKSLEKEELNQLLNCLLVKSFVNSIKIEEREEQEKTADLKCDTQMWQYLLQRFANPALGLKQCFEQSCKGEMLNLLQNVIFSEVWQGTSFDHTKPYQL